MKFDSEADVEATVVALLDERADRAVVEPDMPSATAGQRAVEPPGSGTTRWWLAVAVVLLAAGGVGVALRGGATEPASIGSASEPDPGLPVTTYDLIVWMAVGVDASHVNDLAALLASSTSVQDFVYVDQAATWSEFTEYFAEEPEVIDLVEPESLPTSFRIRASEPGSVIQLASDQPGVEEIEVATPGG